jgi:hypothetical protein
MALRYEEEHEVRPIWSWVILVAVCLAIVAWGLLNYRLIPDAPRKWDMGVVRDVPGQSAYSVAVPPSGERVPKQIEPLPEAAPLPAGGKKVTP